MGPCHRWRSSQYGAARRVWVTIGWCHGSEARSPHILPCVPTSACPGTVSRPRQMHWQLCWLYIYVSPSSDSTFHLRSAVIRLWSCCTLRQSLSNGYASISCSDGKTLQDQSVAIVGRPLQAMFANPEIRPTTAQGSGLGVELCARDRAAAQVPQVRRRHCSCPPVLMIHTK